MAHVSAVCPAAPPVDFAAGGARKGIGGNKVVCWAAGAEMAGTADGGGDGAGDGAGDGGPGFGGVDVERPAGLAWAAGRCWAARAHSLRISGGGGL